ncbi:MAG: twin-arginine translocase subunit TatC, partial [Candidatus Limnocylindrales bacterium]
MSDVDGAGTTIGPEAGASPAVTAPAGEPAAMPLVDHLVELRRRLALSIVAIGVGSVIGFLIAEPLIKLLLTPLPDNE